MLDLARATMDLTALAYHYDRQARRVFGDIIASDGEIRLKSYFYALRSVFALRWVRERRETPPMDLPRLMSGLSISAEIREIIADLVIRKRNMVESDTITRIPLLDAMIREALADKIEKMVSDERSSAGRQADALFASIVREFA
jgi:predicted nucleotidyltransferase